MQEVELNEQGVENALAAGLGVFEKMGAEGDVKSTWDPRNADDVQAARRQFEDLTKNHKYRAYHVTDKHKPGEPMLEFDASAARIIFVPAMIGG